MTIHSLTIFFSFWNIKPAIKWSYTFAVYIFFFILHVQSRKVMFQVNGLRQAQPESMYILFKKVNWTRIWILRAKPDPTQPFFFNLRVGFKPKNQVGFGRTSLHTCCLRFCYWHFDQDLNYCSYKLSNSQNGTYFHSK